MSHVTCHVTKRDAGRDMSRVTVHVSHATTTTPHYTCSLVTSALGSCGHPSHPSLQSVRAHLDAARRRRHPGLLGMDGSLRSLSAVG